MNQNNIELSQDINDIANDEVSNTPFDDAHKTLTHYQYTGRTYQRKNNRFLF